MHKINIVYQNKNMPAEVLPVIHDPEGAYDVTWSRKPLPDSDAVVYFNEYTFDLKEHCRVCPAAKKILYMYEPVAIDPMQYTKRVWKQFDAVLTWNTYLTSSSSAFTFEAGAYFDLPYCSDYGIVPLKKLADPSTREKAICQVSGDKYSLSTEEIYSERRKVARWFNSHAKTRMDVFGRPAMDVPNYRGECDDKSATFQKYRYALCFENSYHPLWTRGYLTEKILDCMATQTIPVYFGCSDIETLVPPDCFIDFRSFHSLDELDTYLQHMSDEEYLGYAERMRDFHAEYNAPFHHSAKRLYETVVGILTQDDVKNCHEYPSDYLDECSFRGKCRFLLMRVLLPHHKLIYPMFSAVRTFKKMLKF